MKTKNIISELNVKYDKYVIILKRGTFCEVYEEDCFVINYLFNYKISDYYGIKKVGFPISILEKVTRELKKRNINYVFFENEKILDSKKFRNNNYICFFDKSKKTIEINLELERVKLLLMNNLNNDLNFDSLLAQLKLIDER